MLKWEAGAKDGEQLPHFSGLRSGRGTQWLVFSVSKLKKKNFQTSTKIMGFLVVFYGYA